MAREGGGAGRSAKAVAKWLSISLGVLLVLAFVAVLVITNTEWGREQVRGFVLAQLEDIVEGQVDIERIEGNLLLEPRLRNVLILDPEGRPFVGAATASFRYSIPGLLRERVVLTRIDLEGAHIVLDDPPDERFNFLRIFQIEPEEEPAEEPDTQWGKWVDLQNIRISDSRLTIRLEWEPDEELPPEAQREEIRRALAGETRERVVEVRGGYQTVMDFRALNAELPRVLAAHPDTDDTVVEIAALATLAEPLNPPTVEVRDFSGTLRVGNDVLRAPEVQLTLASSRIEGSAAVGLETGEIEFDLRADPVALVDFRIFHPPLPDGVEGRARLAGRLTEEVTHLRAEELDFQVRDGWIEGHLDVMLGDTLRVGDTRVRFEGIETALIQDAVPELDLPLQGELTGGVEARSAPDAFAQPDAAGPERPADDARPQRAALLGETDAYAEPVRLEAWLRFDDEEGRSSRVLADGTVGLGAELPMQRVTLRIDPLVAEHVRAAAPDLPIHGVIEGVAVLDGPAMGRFRMESSFAHRDPVAGVSRIRTTGGLDLRDGVRLDDVRVELDPVRLAVLEEQLEQVPRGSTLTGSVRLDGDPGRLLRMESDLALEDPETGVSRIATRGAIGPGEPVRFESFEVELAPLRIPSLRAVVGDLPLTGSLTGTAHLDGAPLHGLAFHADFAHEEEAEGEGAEEPSRFEASGEIATADGGRISAGVELHDLSLATVGRFAPEAELHGTVRGLLRASGSLSDLLVTADLDLPEEGTLETEGTLDLTAEEPEYLLRMALSGVDLNALSGRIDEGTSIGGSLTLSGRGTDPGAMRATVVASLADEAPDQRRVLYAAGRVEEALASVDTLELRTGTSRAHASGSFGLDATRQGELAYEVVLDSLHVFAPLLGTGRGVVEPRPAVREEALDEREAALREAVREAEVEFLATGREPELVEPADTLDIVGLQADVLAGSLRATGTVEGNVERLDARGRLSVEDLLALGNRVDEGVVAYELTGVGGPALSGVVTAEGHSVRLAGFAYDSAFVEAEYRQSDGEADGVGEAELHSGRVTLALHQDEETRILAGADFDVGAEVGELRIEDLQLHFPDATYRTREIAVVRWSDEMLEAREIALESDLGALVQVEGALPREGDGDLAVRIEDLEIAHVTTLLQEREGIRGHLHLDLPVVGTMARPRFQGTAALTGLRMGEERLPDAHIRVAYEDRELAADVTLLEAGRPVPLVADDDDPPGAGDEGVMLTAEAVLPIDLSLVEAEEPRLLPDPIRMEARLHELRLERLAPLTDQLEDVEGRVAGHLSLSGTYEEPVLEGGLDVEAPSLRVVPLGIRVSEVAGALRLEDDVLVVDSLVAYSRGPVRVTGELDMRRFAEPSFDLAIEARDTRIMDTEDVRLRVDADLTVAGAFETVRVRGGVRTRSGVIRIPETQELAAPGPLNLEDPATFERVDQILVEARDALLERPPLLENLQVELEVLIERDVWIRSTELNVELFTPPVIGPLAVRVDGLPIREMELEGTVNMDRGEYEFMGRRFDLSRGSVTFVGGPEIDPLIRLTAEHEVQLPGREAFDIRIILDGTLTDLETELESTAQPPLSQTDLLSLVVFGREAGSLLQQHGSALSGQAGAGGPLVGNVAARATQQFATVGMEALVTELETETARALGLDVLHIQPADTPAEVFQGRVLDVLRGTEIQAGRYVTSRLFVSGQARPTFVHPGARVEYQTEAGYLWRTTWQPRFLPSAPTLAQEEPARASVLGTFLIREWRF